MVFTINAGIKINTSVDRRREQQKEKSVSASDGQCPEVHLFLLILGGVGIADIVSNIERKSSTRGGGGYNKHVKGDGCFFVPTV